MSAETPADAVIEQAAKVMRPLVQTIEGCAIDGGYEPPCSCDVDLSERIAEALDDAGLLADPELRATVARVRSLADEWESEGISCACGHDVGGDHNSNGCYARISYQPLVTCSCTRDCDQSEAEIAAGMIRTALDGSGEQ